MQKFFKIASTAIGILLSIVLIPVLVMNTTIIVKSYINPDKVPDFFGVKPFIVLSGSMEPTIMTDDLAVVKTAKPETLKVGDIISFREENAIITHRIVELSQKDDQPVFITKGDWSGASIDRNPVTYEQVEGKYMSKIPGLGSTAMFMQTPTGMLVFIGIPLIGFILYDILRRGRQNKKLQKVEDTKQAEIDALKAALFQRPGY